VQTSDTKIKILAPRLSPPMLLHTKAKFTPF